ncbi:hypothetical protein AZI86_18930 [Bdellovibrio bacteriovorus]|uniref:Transglutaminase-like domain-containing protein n=1 Tax=Bdellovibrio bacteriovorus TaxID=959 RepID=A0A150WDJ3_BDEBC|nr:transglutaminase-like cysteine peptidase [Bdellovibrio bacteriovorus]KYG60987.1 hypothetical protein AZI86_18930 [Bdellovibrio bacteriovorus]
MRYFICTLFVVTATLFSPLASAGAEFWGKESKMESPLPSGRREAIRATLSSEMLRAAGLWQGVQQMREAPLAERISWVHKVTRQMIRPLEDPSNHWQTPSQTLARRSGDCEDYAVLRIELLRWLGVPSSHMAAFVGTRGGEGHVVAAVSTRNGTWTLDNMSFSAYLSSAPRGFTPEVGVNRQGAWWH